MVATPRLGEDERVVDDKDARIRLLICNTCNTVQPLPWFEGPSQYDDTLNHRLAEHRFPDGNAHLGALATVSEVSWNNPGRRARILEELAATRASNGDTGLGIKMYDLKSTFQEDAMTCWRGSHNRTKNCQDYMSDRMKLVPDTRGERKELGLETRAKHMPTNAWLCQYCPYHSIVEQRQRSAEGYY
jgi:hypothetical protein